MQGNLKSLFDNVPESATLVEVDKSGEPVMDSQRQIKAVDVRIGSTMLVRPGEQVHYRHDVSRNPVQLQAAHASGQKSSHQQSR